MSIQRLPARDFVSAAEGKLLLDVRSPSEYHHAHIPNAISLPLFSDEERKVVGTLYKQESREAAIKKGLEFFGPRMKAVVEEVERLNSSGVNDKEIYIHCWRGGMRSGAIAWLLDLYGFKVYTLAGGYKAYRNLVLETFERNYRFYILGGYTGSGKTEVLQELAKTEARVIDLEKLASHKGSAFGAFNMPAPPGQEMFENLFARELWNCASNSAFSFEGSEHDEPIWLEDESQRIGNINIPLSIWNKMRQSPIFFLEIPFEERLNHIVSEYSQYVLGNLIDSVKRITKRLGPLETKLTVEHLENHRFQPAFEILLKYYDKQYFKALHNRENLSSLLSRIPCDRVEGQNYRKVQGARQPV